MELQLREWSGLCQSSKKSERNKAVKNLSELMGDPVAIDVLNKTSSKDTLNWNVLFSNANNAILLESDCWRNDENKGNCSATVKTNRENCKTLYVSLVETILKKANGHQLKIRSGDILKACFKIFSDGYLKKNFRTHYIGILRDSVLSVRKQRSLINSDEWDELFGHVLKFLKTLDDTTQNWVAHTTLDLMNSVVHFGCQQSQLILQVKNKLLPHLDIMYLALHEKDALHEALLSLTHCACVSVAKESRTAVCHLGELILPQVLQVYKPSDEDDSPKNRLVVDFCLLQVQCHHPKGVKEGSGAAYACDWKKWNHYMFQMYRTMLDSILKRPRMKNPKPFSSSFLDLSVELCNQIFDKAKSAHDMSMTMNETNDPDQGPLAKRRKCVTGIDELFEELHGCIKTASSWPLVSLVLRILEKYHALFKSSELHQLLEILTEMQCCCTGQEVMASISKCCQQLIKVMSSRKLKTDLWLKVWDTSMRTAGLNQSDCQPLLRALMTEKVVPTSALESLLRMYQSGMIHLTNESLSTLLTLVICYHLPESSGLVESNYCSAQWELPIGAARVQLLNWLCSASRDSTIDVQMLAKVLFFLIVKMRRDVSTTWSPRCKVYSKLTETSLESDYCISAFEDDLLIPVHWKPSNSDSQVSHNVCSIFVDSSSQQKLEELLKVKCVELVAKSSEVLNDNPQNQRTQNRSLLLKLRVDLACEMICHACIVANVLSHMIQHGVISEESLNNHCLSARLSDVMTSLEAFLPTILEKEENGGNDPAQDSKITPVLQCLCTLYSSSLWPSVNHLLRKITGQNILIPVVSLFSYFPAKSPQHEISSSNSVVCPILQEHSLPFIQYGASLTDIDYIHFCCLDVLIAYGCTIDSSELHSKQKTVINRIFKVLSDDSIYDLSLESSFIMACKSVYAACSCGLLDSEKHVKPMIKLVQSLCNFWSKNAEAASHILLLLKEILRHVVAEDRKWEKEACLLLLAPFKSRRFGPKFTVQFISCLEEFLKIDPDSKWARWSYASDLKQVVESDSIPREALLKFEDDRKRVAVVEESLFFLSNPFHEVRLAAIPVVVRLFYSQHHTLLWMQTMFRRLSVILYDTFIIKGADMSQEETSDEGSNRTASVLHVLAAIVATSAACYQQALLLSFRLLKEKNLQMNLVKKVFDLLSKPMKISDTQNFLRRCLGFVLDEWLLWGYKLQEFPFRLMNVPSFADFVKQYKGIIIPIVWKNKDHQQLVNSICKEVKCSPLDMFEAAFAPVYAQHLSLIVNVDEASNASTTATKVEKKTFESYESTVGQDKIKQLISNNLDEVLIELCYFVWDPHHHEELVGLNPEIINPSQSSIPRDKFSTAMDHIKRVLDLESDLLIYTGQYRPVIIQKILLQLRIDMFEAVTLDQRIKALHIFSVFCHAVDFCLYSGEFSNMVDFLLCDITHTFLYVIRENISDESMFDVCLGSCSFLNVFYTNLLPNFASAVSSLLPSIVGSLIPLALRKDKLSNMSMVILQLLIVENGADMKDAVCHLPPFPEDSLFEEIRNVHNSFKAEENICTLEDEIKHFLSSASGTTSLAYQNSMFDGLHYLKTQLCEKKGELQMLYQNLQHMRGFSKDCKESVLHQLICKLISLSSAADSKVQIEASRCLGELGAADLTTLVLRPFEGCSSVVNGYAKPMMCVMALAGRFLSEYLMDHDVYIVKKASCALTSLMACKEARGLHSAKGGFNVIESKKISPFILKEPTSKALPSLRQGAEDIISLSCDESIWNPYEEMEHSEWVTKLTCALLAGLSDDDVFMDLASVCKVKTSFAEELLPVLFYLGVSYSDVVGRELLKCLAQFFEKHCTSSVKDSQTSGVSSDSSLIFLKRPSVQCLLNVVHFLRQKGAKCGDGRFYLHVASAAQFCGAYLSSILYLELWCNSVNRPANFDGSSLALVDLIAENQPEEGKLLQKLLSKAYEQIGDNDALYGCGSAILLDSKTQVSQYEHGGKWDKILLSYDVKMAHRQDVEAASGLVSGLQHSGLYHLLNTFVNSVPPDQREQQLPAQLECMWRLGQWSKPLSAPVNAGCFEWNQFSALEAVHYGDVASVKEFVMEGRMGVLKELSLSSLENCKNIYRPLSQLQAFQEIEDFVTSTDILKTIQKWQDQNALPHHDLLKLEPILAQRSRLIETQLYGKALHNTGDENCYELTQQLTQLYLQTAELARKEEQIQIAEQWLHSLSVMPHLSIENKRQLRLEKAQLAWSSSQNLSNGTSSIARLLLKSLLKELRASVRDTGIQSKMLPQVYILYGKWVAEAHSENPLQIIEDYLMNAVELLEELPSLDSVHDQQEAHSCLAHFADLEYQRITAYMNSESFLSKKRCLEILRSDASKVNDKATNKGNKREINDDQATAARITLKVSELDDQEVKNTLKDQDTYIELALRHYLKSMMLGEVASLPVFRMVSLWLQNTTKDAVNNQVTLSLGDIQTYKFVVLLPQLAARLGNNMNDSFTKAIYKLLLRCCVEHPHHALPLILALANTYEDFEGKVKPEPEPRVLGAQSMLAKLHKIKGVCEILSEMDKLSKALICLAYAKIPSEPSKDIPVGSKEKIRQIHNFCHAMLPTITLPVQSDAKYDRIISIHSFDKKYNLAGGINKPKKIICIGTDGIQRPLMVKGKDDLRQDAVMQQVFTILNTLLQACPETKRRKLLIRTYKIVPLSQRCGVLQWCDNTLPLGIILRNVHLTHNPGDWDEKRCTRILDDAAGKSHGERLRVFKEICKNFRPAFRFFFTDKYLNPAEWFNHRMAYVHSVATNSMVGYILGLGDRHCSNILVDQRTAELIHIDFGIAFEQGKVLRTPETVPFRLTRDLVDGMGVSGVEGVFQRSCEKTMAVLRKNLEKISTILEVLLYDPLYSWSLTPKVAAEIQGKGKSSRASLSVSEDGQVSNIEKNKMAERALCKLCEKLQGTEEGPVSSIEGQVNRLIQQARDLGNLSRLFRGWQAFY